MPMTADIYGARLADVLKRNVNSNRHSSDSAGSRDFCRDIWTLLHLKLPLNCEQLSLSCVCATQYTGRLLLNLRESFPHTHPLTQHNEPLALHRKFLLIGDAGVPSSGPKSPSRGDEKQYLDSKIREWELLMWIAAGCLIGISSGIRMAFTSGYRGFVECEFGLLAGWIGVAYGVYSFLNFIGE